MGDAGGDPVRVTEEEFGGVNEYGVVLFGGNFKSPEHRLREGAADGIALFSIVRDSAKLLIFSHQEDLFAATLKMDHVAFAGLATIQANVIGTHAVGERFVEDEWCLPFGFVNAKTESAFARVPVVGDKSGQGLHVSGLLCDAGKRF